MDKYDFLIIGSGIFGATVAERLKSAGKKVLVIDRRAHLAGNIYSYMDEKTGIEVHAYGSHIFHTESDEVWDYITKFADFNDYVHTVHTRHDGKLYPMPINLDTINLFYGTNLSAAEAEKFIKQKAEKIDRPKNFAEQAKSLVGTELFEAFLKNYTEKQWRDSAEHLPAALLSRIPVRFSSDARYFMSAKHQGIPKNGYTNLIKNLLKGIDYKLNTSFKDLEPSLKNQTIIYTGAIDELMDYEFGALPYRSLRFETETVENSAQKEAVINEADADVPYTRTHSYKYYQIHSPEIINQPLSVISREYPADFKIGAEAYYPVNNEDSEALYQKYLSAAREKYPNMYFGGRLGAFRYWDMDIAVKNALDLSEKILKETK
ncbi:UDP-galactopyranose mutase [Candidatus Saccharibacteria bacterium]|nr:UDP-galactopyranose mutase [Candidatus Saccharibacteria bacterium]